MDCYFHSNVPAIAPCVDCGKQICATCRDQQGTCPSCRLSQRSKRATATRTEIPGQVPPRPAPAASAHAAAVAESAIRRNRERSYRSAIRCGRSRLISLLDPKQSRQLRRQAFQALGFNVGFFGFGALLSLFAQVPFLGFSAWVLVPLLVPFFLVASVYYGIKTWNGEDVRIPIVTSWLDERMPYGDTKSR